MSTRMRSTPLHVVALTYFLIACARAHKAAIAAFNQDRSIKLLDEPFLGACQASADQLAALSGGQHVSAVGKAGAGVDQTGARQTLHASWIDIRDDINLSYPKDRVIRKAFGMGTRGINSTPKLLAAAQNTIAAWAMPRYQQRAIDAGVTGERIDEVTALYEQLRASGTEQTMQVAAGKDGTQTAEALRRALSVNNTFMRKSARRIFRGQPNVVAQFMTTPPGTFAAAAAREPVEPTEPGEAKGQEPGAAKATAPAVTPTTAAMVESPTASAAIDQVTTADPAAAQPAAAQPAAAQPADGKPSAKARAAKAHRKGATLSATKQPAIVVESRAGRKPRRTSRKAADTTGAKATTKAAEQPAAHDPYAGNHANGHSNGHSKAKAKPTRTRA